MDNKAMAQNIKKYSENGQKQERYSPWPVEHAGTPASPVSSRIAAVAASAPETSRAAIKNTQTHGS